MENTDYYSVLEKRRYYHWMSINPRINPNKQAFARKKYLEFKHYTLRIYKPSFVTNAKEHTITMGDLISKYEKMKTHWDWLGTNEARCKKIIMDYHHTYGEELNRLHLFRHRYKISLSDYILVDVNLPKTLEKKILKYLNEKEG